MTKKKYYAIWVKIYGRVQGVGFRYSTIHQAVKLSLTGYVKNMNDGTVEVIAEGEAEKLDNLVKWLKKGPSGAHVINIELINISFSGCFKGFTIE